MKYRALNPISREEAATAFASHLGHEVGMALARCAEFDPEYEWVESRCLEFVEHPSVEVRRAAAAALGNLARVHRRTSIRTVEALERLARSTETAAGWAEDALDDLRMFARSALPDD